MTSIIGIIGLTVVLTTFNPKTIINSDPYLAGIDSTNIDEAIPAVQMYYYIKKYSNEYGIPEDYAFSVAYVETRYQGPCDVKYNPIQTSYAGACGPMQIMPATAKLICKKKISRNQLHNDIDLNVKISIMLMRNLHDKYNNWGKVFGAYNTGRPCINSYARKILSKKYNWAI
jgi:soluble lytic murein transglycosylase-like protein